MTQIIEVLAAPSIQQALAKRSVSGVHVDVFDNLPSTSEYLTEIAQQNLVSASVEELLSGAPQLCATDWQTNGNGRRGKTWVTERGNVTFSLLLPMNRAPAQLLGLSLVTGICVAQSLTELGQVPVQLKWPNDVLAQNQKLAGLLTELISSPQGVTQINVGVGINYKIPSQIETSDYQPVSLPSLNDSPPSRSELIADICSRLLSAYAQFAQQGWPAFADTWDQFDYLKSKQVKVLSGEHVEKALAVGVDEQGALLVEIDGVRRAVFSGEVSVRPV